MRILFISYGNYEFDGRLRELFAVVSKLGETFLFSRGASPISRNHTIINKSYSKFIFSSIKYGKKIGDIDVLFLDNRKSIIPGLRLKKFYKNAKIILDCRELYLSKYVRNFTSKIGCYIEKKGIKKSDAIICANKERSSFMKKYYHLTRDPIVFENYRKLEFTSVEAMNASLEKFKSFNIDAEYRIVSTAGCDISRLTDILVKNMSNVVGKSRLFLVGNSTQKEIEIIEKICKENNIDNITILGSLKQDDLKALLSYCHIGIVSYHQKDFNNIYCASGKIFEFLEEKMPVVTTTNPPLKSFCDETNVGECSDVFYDAINKVISSYDYYKSNVESFCSNNKYRNSAEVFYSDLCTYLKQI